MIPLGVLASARVGGWTPASLSLVAWFDASDPSTITESGGAVSQWADKSGNGHHVTQTTALRKPATGTRTQNGLNVLDFDNSILTRGSVTTDVVTIGLVAKFDTLLDYRYFASLNTGTAVTGAAIIGRSDGITFPKFIAYDGAFLSSDKACDTNPHAFVAVFNGASSSFSVDGGTAVAGNAGTKTGTGICFGSMDGRTTYAIDGMIAEYVLASGALGAADLASLTTYLKTKWGIA